MVGPDDVIVWKDIATGGAAVISGVVVFVVNSFTKRLDDHEKEDRETFRQLFKGQKELSDQVGVGFRGLDKTVNEIHVKLLERISDVQQNKDWQGNDRRNNP